MFPSYVSVDAQVRDAAGAANKALSELAIETAMRYAAPPTFSIPSMFSLTQRARRGSREDIFQAFMEYYNHTMPQETLTPVQRRRTAHHPPSTFRGDLWPPHRPTLVILLLSSSDREDDA